MKSVSLKLQGGKKKKKKTEKKKKTKKKDSNDAGWVEPEGRDNYSTTESETKRCG